MSKQRKGEREGVGKRDWNYSKCIKNATKELFKERESWVRHRAKEVREMKNSLNLWWKMRRWLGRSTTKSAVRYITHLQLFLRTEHLEFRFYEWAGGATQLRWRQRQSLNLKTLSRSWKNCMYLLICW